MGDPEAAPQPGLPAEISNSLAMVWRRYAGHRPANVETTVSGTRVACVLRESVRDFDAAIAASRLDDGAPDGVMTVSSYKREAIAAVAKATRRRVVAFVSDHDETSDTAKEVFLLDRPPWRQPSIPLDRQSD